ncbi:MAG: NusG domain II-containing protein [Ruminococcus sp.]|nr:NusG domain II-containing protein [Ruminococcus sp.]
MTPAVRICMIFAAVLFVSAVIAVILMHRPAESSRVVIIRENGVIYSLDLANEPDRTFRITAEDGSWNEVTIDNGTICISDADCPDLTCVHTGVLRSESVPIVCLPHKLVIRFDDGDTEAADEG